MRLSSLRAALATATTFLLLTSPSSALPLSSAPLTPLAHPPTLSIDLKDSLVDIGRTMQNVFAQSTPRYQCAPSSLTIYNAVWPVTIDAVYAKDLIKADENALRSPTVPPVALIATNWTAERVEWGFQGLQEGKEVVVRVIDTTGQVAYTQAREAVVPGWWTNEYTEQCKSLPHSIWEDIWNWTLLLCTVPLVIVCLLGILWCLCSVSDIIASLGGRRARRDEVSREEERDEEEEMRERV